MKIFHDPRSAEYAGSGHPERPARITRSVPLLQQRHADWIWQLPTRASHDALLRAHTPEHIAAVESPIGDFDADSPAYADIFAHASRASGAAIGAAHAALAGEKSFSLMRPPGHHAMRDRAMGFCYFSHIGIAALDAIAGRVERVAIWDFDAHHGNGTEDIVAHNRQIMFASIHQFPGYPGTGTQSFGNVINIPVAPYSPPTDHVAACEKSLKLLLDFRPQLLLVSAGFDAYRGDPITQMTLEQDDFATFGSWLRDVSIPTAAILEGGYSDELPELIDAFLTAWISP